MSPGAYSEEVAKFLSIYSIFFSMAYAVKENAHIVTDILPDNLPVRVSTAIDIFANVAFLAFSMLMIYFGIEYTQSMYLFERPTEAMSAPLWIFITILPIGFALTSVRLLLKLRLLVRAMKTGEKIQTVEIF
jgi:TRAP-type C4-dicarboxylate transport system permease small subunit